MRTCLVVDDSSVIRKVARRILEGLDFQIVEAEDGAKALDACKRAMPEAVLLDWNMPVMDGITLIQNVRKDPAHKNKPILMLTTEGLASKKQEGRAAGATGWIVKPFDPEKLLQTVAKVLP